MSDAWRHTHTVTLRDGSREVYLDDEGRAYTREEWDAEVSADIERRPDGVWTFLGDPRGVLEVRAREGDAVQKFDAFLDKLGQKLIDKRKDGDAQPGREAKA